MPPDIAQQCTEEAGELCPGHAVNDPMVIRQGKRHDQMGSEFAVFVDRFRLCTGDSQYGDFRCVNHRREIARRRLRPGLRR